MFILIHNWRPWPRSAMRWAVLISDTTSRKTATYTFCANSLAERNPARELLLVTEMTATTQKSNEFLAPDGRACPHADRSTKFKVIAGRNEIFVVTYCKACQATLSEEVDTRTQPPRGR